MREYNTMLLLHNYMMWREALIYYLLHISSPLYFPNDKLSLDEFTQQLVGQLEEVDDSVKSETPDKLPQTVTDRIKTFVFFVGHIRSGHSIIDSLTDGLLHMVIRHEYNLFTKLVSG